MKALLIFIFFHLLSSCSLVGHKDSGATSESYEELERSPSSEIISSACADLLAEGLRLGHGLEDSAWDKAALVARTEIDEADYDFYSNSKSWETFVDQGLEKSQSEKEMGYSILSILKKRFPNASEENLKDRYLVLAQYCS